VLLGAVKSLINCIRFYWLVELGVLEIAFSHLIAFKTGNSQEGVFSVEVGLDWCLGISNQNFYCV